MSLADEILRLEQLRDRGSLSAEEFQRAKDRVLSGPSGAPLPPPVQTLNTVRRSVSDRWLGGVCGGLGRMTGLESWIWRLLFAVMAMVGGTGILIYVLLWIFVPEATDEEDAFGGRR